MKLFFGEFKPDYESYFFPYQVWLLKEERDKLEDIYNAGFLPIRNRPNVYYLSRNIRVDLGKFALSSENRRILNKTSEFSFELMSLDKFQYSPYVQKLCKDYMVGRFGKGYMSTSGIKNIFQKGVYNYVFVWKKKDGEVMGYAVCFINDGLLQYAHAFYDLNQTEEHLGIRMLLQSVIWARENGLKFVYLGTVYNKSSFSYKTEFTGVEFFNGFCWSSNLEELKKMIERENNEYLLKDQNYLNEFHSGDIIKLLHNFGVRVKF